MRWIYHPIEEAKIITLDEVPYHLENGWYLTPADFTKNIEEIETEINILKKRGRKPKTQE